MTSIPVPSKSDTLRVASALTAADGRDQRVETGDWLPCSFAPAGYGRIMFRCCGIDR